MKIVRLQYATKQPKSILVYRFLSISVVIYFVLRLSFLAITMSTMLPSDEIAHIENVQHFSEHVFPPNTDLSAEKAHLRLLPYEPYLYYVIAGKWVLLNVFDFDDYMFIRFLTIPMALLTIYYGWRFIKLLSPDPLLHLIFLVMITNTLMFSVMSAAVSYDMLTCLWAAMSIYYLAEFEFQRTPISIVYMILSIALGCLTKFTMLPLAFALLVCLLVMEARKLPSLLKNVREFWLTSGRTPKGWILCTLIAITLNGLLYGGNLIRFHRVTPSPTQLLSSDEMLLNPVHARNSIYKAYKAGEFDIEEAIDRARRISHIGMRYETIRFLKTVSEQDESDAGFEPISRIAYLKPWYTYMLVSTYGILGHESVFRTPNGRLPFTVSFVISVGLMLLRTVQKKILPIDAALAFIVLFYILVLILKVNYPAYRIFHTFSITLYGRYLFPLILPIYALVVKYILSMSSQSIKLLIALIIASVYIYGDFIFYITH